MANVVEYLQDKTTHYVRNEQWQEITGPVLFNFDKVGDRLEGYLVEMKNEPLMDEKTKQPRMVLTCKIRHDDGSQTKFRPSYDLREKLGRNMLGQRMLIVFHGENAATESKGNKMKMFRVFVAPKATTEEPPFVPTDDDLPEF